MLQTLQSFQKILLQSLEEDTFIKLQLLNKRHKNSDLKSVHGKVIQTKKGSQLSLVYRHKTKDITKNYPFQKVEEIVSNALLQDFFQMDLQTTKMDYLLSISAKNEVRWRENAPKSTILPEKSHDKLKNRVVSAQGAAYLQELGVLSESGMVKHNKQDKFRQINKFVEILEGLVKEKYANKEISVMDMGSGKGYLTFALYDYLVNNIGSQAQVTGIELREDLVEKCNAIAQKCGFTGLQFEQGSIEEKSVEGVEVLIALHACDTATDDAIFKGIKSGADCIVCAPCCHKQIRKEMKPSNELSLITKHGILAERQAEMVTDTIRSLILEAFGYKTKVFEFISDNHTPKNVMIIGEKGKKENREKALEKIKKLKAMFGVEIHYLEKLIAPLLS